VGRKNTLGEEGLSKCGKGGLILGHEQNKGPFASVGKAHGKKEKAGENTGGGGQISKRIAQVVFCDGIF